MPTLYRTLETLYNLFETKPNLLTNQPFSVILNSLSEQVKVRLTFDQVKAALRGNPLDINEKILSYSGVLKRVDSLISDGIFTNSLTDEERVIPQLSLVSIYRWAQKHTTVPSPSLDPSLHNIVADLLMKIILLEDHFDGLAYEKFHAGWELLRHLLFEDEFRNPCTLSTFYGITETKSKRPQIYFSPKKAVKQLKDQFPSDPLVDEDENIVTSEDITNFIFLPSACNPGFDQAKIEHTSLETFVAINTEDKFSSSSASTTLGIGEVMSKFKLMRDQYRNYLTVINFFSPKKKAFFFFICKVTLIN